jgi:prepilin-type N-terminal cleavage/methylation domain-containing protein
MAPQTMTKSQTQSSKLQSGFTLIELMIAITIVGILAAIALPKFGTLVRRSKEGATRGSLGTLRSAISIYYSDMEGQFPSLIASLTVSGKYMSVIPRASLPYYHVDSSLEINCGGFDVCDIAMPFPDDSGGWAYNSAASDQNFGTVFVNCSHTDTKGTKWTSY